MPTIGSRIRTRREELGLSQDELAKRLGYKSPVEYRKTIEKSESKCLTHTIVVQ